MRQHIHACLRHANTIIIGIAAATIVLASCGFGALFAYQTAISHSFALACITVAFAISLEVIKPFAVSAAIAAAGLWQPIRCALLSLLALVAIAYSLTAELSLVAGSKTDASDIRATMALASTTSRQVYDDARRELAALPPSRLLGEIEAALQRGSSPKLLAEHARAMRRLELQELMAKNSSATIVSSSDPGATAVRTYLALAGVQSDQLTISQLLTLVPVLAIEIASALSMVLMNACKPALMVHEATAKDQQEPSRLLEVDHYSRQCIRDEAARRIIGYLKIHGGSLSQSERNLAKLLGVDRNTARRAIQGLGEAGLIALEPSKRGTTMKLLAYRS